MEYLVEKNIFEDIKHIDEFGNEYWSAKELMKVLNYRKWQRFAETIKRAMNACQNSNNETNEHFTRAGKVLKVGNNAEMRVLDYYLTRYACYLIAQNGDSRKKVRDVIKEIGGTLPEDLPTPSKSIKEIEKERLMLR